MAFMIGEQKTEMLHRIPYRVRWSIDAISQKEKLISKHLFESETMDWSYLFQSL